MVSGLSLKLGRQSNYKDANTGNTEKSKSSWNGKSEGIQTIVNQVAIQVVTAVMILTSC